MGKVKKVLVKEFKDTENYEYYSQLGCVKEGDKLQLFCYVSKAHEQSFEINLTKKNSKKLFNELKKIHT